MRKCPEVHGGQWPTSWEDSAPLSSACSATAVTGALEGGIHEADKGSDGGRPTATPTGRHWGLLTWAGLPVTTVGPHEALGRGGLVG